MRFNTLWMSRSFICVALTAISAAPAYAVLGQPVETAARRMQGTLRASSVSSSSTSLYSAQTSVTDAGSVTEYADLSGTVFAVTWQGISNPDLSVLMGDYFAEYNRLEKSKVANRQLGARRQPLDLSSSQVRVQRFGHMRDLHGRAFVLSLVPAGVNAEELP